MTVGCPGFEPGTSRMEWIITFLIKKVKTPPQAVLAFFIAHGFPYVYISSFFRKTLKKVQYSVDLTLDYISVLYLLTFQNSRNKFFVMPSSFFRKNFHFQDLRMLIIGQIVDTNNIQIPNPTSMDPPQRKRSSWKDQRKNLFFRRKKFFQ